jgi:lipopolysaccharide export system protein LptA
MRFLPDRPEIPGERGRPGLPDLPHRSAFGRGWAAFPGRLLLLAGAPIFLGVMLFAPLLAGAAEDPPGAIHRVKRPASSKVLAHRKAPVAMVVRADHMLARNIENEITFSGHVHLVKGTLRLTSDDLIVYLRKAGKGKTLMEETGQGRSSQRVETMVATGHVIIRTPRRTAYSGRAVYVEAAHLFVLTREPVVIQNGDRMSGERITFFTRLNKSVVQGHSLMLLDSGGRKSSPPSRKAAPPGPSGGVPGGH